MAQDSRDVFPIGFPVQRIMALKKNLDRILSQWSYEPNAVKVRVVQGDDGRDVIQMRVDMGILQLEIEGRPDGSWPYGYGSFYEYLLSEELLDDEFELSEEQSAEVDREFIQYYHRRVCWLSLRAFDRAVKDADHTLALMDFCLAHSSDEEWTISHEQYRPFVLFHRIQAAALDQLENQAPEAAIEALNDGLRQLRELFDDEGDDEEEDEIEFDESFDERFDEHVLVARLVELRESLRSHYQIGRTLEERLQEAVATEQYELAARLRDEMARRRARPRAY
jgi:hypothetical protein